jgi:hypothetical protein
MRQLEADRWLCKAPNTREEVAFCGKANAEIHALYSEALELIPDDQCGVLYSWRGEIM